jgi:hypothetical protein
MKGGIVAGGALVIAAEAGYGLASDPEAVRRFGAPQLALLGIVLLAYLGAGLWAWRSRRAGVEIPLRAGAALGILLGVIGAASLTAEELAGLRPPWNAVLPATEMAVMVILFGAAATLALRRSGSQALALLAALWSAAVGTSLICAYGLALQLAVLGPRGQGSLENTLGNAVLHLLIAPAVAVVAGAAGIAAALLQRSSRPPVRLALALWDLAQAAAGIGLLIFASSLARPDRPPFVMAGMLLTAAALACAPALLRVEGRPIEG